MRARLVFCLRLGKALRLFLLEVRMKNTVKVLLFLAILTFILYLTNTYEYILSGFFGYLSIIITLTVTVIAFVIFLENRHPTQTLTWLVVLAGFPVLGFIFYLLFGRNYRKEKMFRKKYFLDKQTFMQYEGPDPVSEEKLKQSGTHQKRLFYLAQRLGNSPISFGTDTKVLTNGNETYNSILDELQKAVHHIHLEYYIVRDDE